MEEKIIHRLKMGVWLYFILLIFEGALRKWVLPGLAGPLLIIRDPLAIWILFVAFRYSLLKPNTYILLMWGATILAVSLALFIGHGNISVALYGFRITAIHFPLIFVIGRIFDREDVLQLGKVVLWLSIGMTILVAVQFYSPQSAFVNRGIGGDLEGSGFGGAAGFFRVPGTFSFTNGLSYFYGLVSAYVFYFWLEKGISKQFRILLIFSSLALIAAIPLSISRTILFQILVSFVFMLAVAGKNIKAIPRIGIALVAMGIILFTIQDFSFFETASMAFEERFTTANKIEGGMEGVFVDRFLGGMYGAITNSSFPFWGLGLGMGTNVGAQILVGDAGKFLVSEGEWGRIIGEMGILLGLLVIFVRLSLVVYLVKKTLDAVSNYNILPWMLLSFGMILILQGQWAQPTTLGFSVFTGGLILSSLRKGKF